MKIQESNVILNKAREHEPPFLLAQNDKGAFLRSTVTAV